MYLLLLLGGFASWGLMALILLRFRSEVLIFHEIFLYLLGLGGLLCFGLARIIKLLSDQKTESISVALDDTQKNKADWF